MHFDNFNNATSNFKSLIECNANGSYILSFKLISQVILFLMTTFMLTRFPF